MSLPSTTSSWDYDYCTIHGENYKLRIILINLIYRGILARSAHYYWKKRRAFALKIEGGSLFAHRAGGTTYATHSLELKVKEKLSNV